MGDPRDANSPLFAPGAAWKLALAAAIGMVLLALLGVGLTTTSPAAAAAYWIALVPIFGLVCVATAYAHARQTGAPTRPAVTRQVLHWLGIGVAVALDFFLRRTGEETGATTGLTALLLLALGCYLAGVHLNPLFVVVGLLLTAVLVVITKVEQNLMLIAGACVLAIILILAAHRFFSGRPLAPAKANAGPST